MSSSDLPIECCKPVSATLARLGLALRESVAAGGLAFAVGVHGAEPPRIYVVFAPIVQAVKVEVAERHPHTDDKQQAFVALELRRALSQTTAAYVVPEHYDTSLFAR
jgi:hypothetical protein